MDVIFTVLLQKWLLEKMCPCTSQHHWIPQCKCVLRCCEKCPDISMPHQETNIDATKTCSEIRFYV